MEHLVLKIYGKVQDVFFRDTTKEMADSLEICGYVKNCLDGSVLIEAEGDSDSLDLLTVWAKKGPRGAQVERVEIESAPIQHYKTFRIL